MSELAALAYETSSRDAIWPLLPVVVTLLDTGEIVYVSGTVADLFGYTTSELLGRPVEVLIPPALREAHVRARQSFPLPHARLMGLGRLLTGLRKDGSVIPVQVEMMSCESMGKHLGIALVLDLTSMLHKLTMLSSGPAQEITAVATPIPSSDTVTYKVEVLSSGKPPPPSTTP